MVISVGIMWQETYEQADDRNGGIAGAYLLYGDPGPQVQGKQTNIFIFNLIS